MVHFTFLFISNTYTRSLELIPGKERVIVPHGDLRVSNAALGEVLGDQNGRTVVKITYSKLGGGGSDDEDDEESADEDEGSFSSLVLCALTAGKVIPS